MPYKTDKEILPGLLDERFKILPCQIEQILVLHSETGMSYRQIAERFGVSKSTVYYICNPDRRAEMREKDRNRQRTDKKESVAKVLRSRKRKHQLLKSSNNAIQSQTKESDGGDQGSPKS